MFENMSEGDLQTTFIYFHQDISQKLMKWKGGKGVLQQLGLD